MVVRIHPDLPMLEIKAPNKLRFDKPSVFLAGSIEMGMAEEWQKKVVEALRDEDVIVFNPRRDDWDSSWIQDIDNKPFRRQVEWELEAQEKASLILFYFSPNTKSPITLLELGLVARNRKQFVMVCCPEGFWRKGNVDIVCERYGISTVSDINKLGEYAKIYLAELCLAKPGSLG